MYPTFIKNVKGVLKKQKAINTNKKGDNPNEEVSPLSFFVCYYSKNGYPNSKQQNYITKTREPAAIIHIRQSPGKKN
ncbi:hypothetical protein DW036_17560 [Bacteroides sp. AF39-11AC]|jgi:hypothetical protein|nr:hypothetical protein DW036_17560 [Bacteroides sp. AF39-11AC]